MEQDGKDVVLEFRPQDGSDMLVACLWSSWIGMDGEELLSFAAITDEPPTRSGRLATIGASSDQATRTWTQVESDPANLPAQYAILDDRERPYYEHREAA